MEEELDKLAFARRFRPTSLDGYIGNYEVKETVRNYLKKGRPQSILLKGHSGCGKTTLARILAREYCCEDWTAEKGSCGVCSMCLAFEDYIKTGVSEMLPDIYEIDSSDKSSKKDVDSMLESMEYPAVMGNWKVYIIDEAHLLSAGAMGRLLKSLEEPPEGVLIILCTTDPDKLLDTIRNRCQLSLDITKPSTKDIMDLLQRVCLQEDKNYDLAGLRMLAGRADNVVRDSLNNLERVLNTRGDATAKSVSVEFKQVSDKLIFDFFKAYIEENYVDYINVLYRIRVNLNFNQFVDSLTAFIIRGIYIMNSIEVEGLSSEELTSYLNLFSKFTAGELSKILSELKKMKVGDVEANLMAFIYCKHDNDKVVVNQHTYTDESVVTVEDERLIRNSNLEKLETAKLDRGKQSIASVLEEVSISEMGDMFSLEKVTD